VDDAAHNQQQAERPPARSGAYVVIARRYRPQTFDELVGQEHVAEALRNAIAAGRVGHAYLFTGARGVGKTSAARILAKALNCREGPTPNPCNQCDICQRISRGEDVDVLEIDGASNRGIDEIRQLRENAGIRPTRSRFKLYIIDEVHMLTREAFNALLKTLEEPPPHVKFIFCTTEPTRLPDTILSRCQRFDFAGISNQAIVRRLGQIVEAEGLEAEPEALQLLAQRAGGSMRDSQSLLEQLLAFCTQRISAADVHRLLGTADAERLYRIARLLAERNAAGVLEDLDAALAEGADPALVVEDLFIFFRDLMAVAAGCKPQALLRATPEQFDELTALARSWGLTSLLAVMQILEQALGRMRFSTQVRVVAELALVRICQLEDLEELGRVIAQLKQQVAVEQHATGQPGGQAAASGSAAAQSSAGGQTPAPARAGPSGRPTLRGSGTTSNGGTASRGTHVSSAAESEASKPAPASPGRQSAPEAAEAWHAALERLSGILVDHARRFRHVHWSDATRLVISFEPRYAVAKDFCERPEQARRLEKALAAVVGRPVRVEFRLEEASVGEQAAKPRAVSPRQQLLQVAKHPLIQRAGELFGAQPVHIDEPPEKE